MEAALHLGVGLTFCFFRQYDQALSSLIHCQQLALSSGDECREDVASRSLFEALVELINRDRQPEKTWSSMVPLFERYSKSVDEARCWSSYFLGKALSFDSDNCDPESPNQTTSAVFWLANALELSVSLPYVKYMAALRLADFYKNMSTCAMYFELQIEAARCLRRSDYLAYALFQLGNACINTNDFDQAIKVREELIEIAKGSKDKLLQGLADNFCGLVACALGQHRECITLNTRVVENLKPLPASWSTYYAYSASEGTSVASPTKAEATNFCMVEALAQMVHSHSRLKEFADALARAKMCEEHLEKLFNTDARKAKLSYLNALCALQRSAIWERTGPEERECLFKESEATLAETLKLSEELGNSSIYIGALVKMTEVAASFKRESKNGELYLYAHEEEDVHYFEMVDSFLAEAERLALELCPEKLLQVLSARGIIYFQMQMPDKVVEKLENFAKIFFEAYYKFGSFSKGRILFNEDWKTSFQMLQVALIRAKTRAHHALIWAERERARDLIYNTSEAVSQELTEFDLDDTKALQEILSIPKHADDQDTVFLIYTSLFGSHGFCGFLLHATCHFGCFTRIDAPWNISELVQITIDKRLDERSLQWWYKHLILPFDEKLETIKPKKLVIVPGEDFSSLPFAALLKEDGEPFLIQRYAISYSPSLRMYKHCKERGEALMKSGKRSSALVIGNPATSLAKDLPHAEKEAIYVKDSLIKAGFQDVQLIEKQEATKESVLSKVKTADWVHFSCHATVNKEFPNGALLLASLEQKKAPTQVPHVSTRSGTDEAKIEDRKNRLLTYLQELPPSDVLTGAELESCQTKMQALVTVLSACQSGLGEVVSEGVMGIYRSLHVSGAPSVVCSLWQVDDESTKFLMEQLYEKMLDGTELVIALQQVMVEMIDDVFSDNSMIRNWATFIISGNPNMKLV